jgi:DNA-binding XRE family transcriptional regulator
VLSWRVNQPKPTKLAHGDSVSATGSAANEPALITRKQLAQKLGLSERSIDNLQRRRALPVIKLSNRCCRFSLAACLASLRRFEVEAVK